MTKDEQELEDRKIRYAKLLELMKDWPRQNEEEAKRRGMTLEEYYAWWNENFKPEPIRI